MFSLIYYYVYSAGVGRTDILSGVYSCILLCIQYWCRAYSGFILYIIMLTVLVEGGQGISSIYYYVYSVGVGRTGVSPLYYVYSAGVGRTGFFSYILLCLHS